MGHADLESAFPDLRRTAYRIASPHSYRYNCIAWAAGADDRRWWPRPSYYWPVPATDESLNSFVEGFRFLGYEICDCPDHEAGFEKVAIYVGKDDKPTHMARRLDSGEWTSKCGGLDDIVHTLEGLEGLKYGSVAVIMRRKQPRT